MKTNRKPERKRRKDNNQLWGRDLHKADSGICRSEISDEKLAQVKCKINAWFSHPGAIYSVQYQIAGGVVN